MRYPNAWQMLDDWAMEQPTIKERVYAAKAARFAKQFAQAQSEYGPWMLLVTQQQMLEAMS